MCDIYSNACVICIQMFKYLSNCFICLYCYTKFTQLDSLMHHYNCYLHSTHILHITRIRLELYWRYYKSYRLQHSYTSFKIQMTVIYSSSSNRKIAIDRAAYVMASFFSFPPFHLLNYTNFLLFSNIVSIHFYPIYMISTDITLSTQINRMK